MTQEYVEELRTLAGTIVSRDRIVQEITEEDGACTVRTVLREPIPDQWEGYDLQDMPIYSRIGRQLHYMRLEADMSLEDVGRAAGMSRQAVSSIERGRKRCAVETVQRLARVLGYDITFKKIRHHGKGEDNI